MTSELHGRGLQAKFDTAAPAATAARATLFSQEVGHLRKNLQYYKQQSAERRQGQTENLPYCVFRRRSPDRQAQFIDGQDMLST